MDLALFFKCAYSGFKTIFMFTSGSISFWRWILSLLFHCINAHFLFVMQYPYRYRCPMFLIRRYRSFRIRIKVRIIPLKEGISKLIYHFCKRGNKFECRIGKDLCYRGHILYYFRHQIRVSDSHLFHPDPGFEIYADPDQGLDFLQKSIFLCDESK